MVNQFWRRSKKEIVSTSHLNYFYLIPLASIAVIAVVTHHSYSFHTFVKMPNGLSFSSHLEPSRR
jgi:hypothetical protein